jgi:hypothetical protein
VLGEITQVAASFNFSTEEVKEALDSSDYICEATAKLLRKRGINEISGEQFALIAILVRKEKRYFELTEKYQR